MSKRTIPYGYRIANGIVIIDPEAAKVIAEVFDTYLAGASLKSLAATLTAEKINYHDGKFQWEKAMVKRILDNEIYTSSEKYPHLINEEKFRAAQNLLRSKYHGYSNDPIAAVIKKRIFCGVCGKRFIHNTKSRIYTRW